MRTANHAETQSLFAAVPNGSAVWTIRDTGKTRSGNARDIKVERVGKVTIYQRGRTFFVYYRPNGRSIRRRLAADLVTARAKAAEIALALSRRQTSP
jgi:hypothetical protein